jgi:hypothetical protein
MTQISGEEMPMPTQRMLELENFQKIFIFNFGIGRLRNFKCQKYYRSFE